MFVDYKKLKVSEYYILFLIVAVSFAFRIYLRSNYLDDWDSVDFMLGLKNFSLISQQPHPPGYPVYIFLGRIMDHFFNNGLESFTFISALSGSIALIPTYLLAKEFFGYRVGLLSAIILSLVPAEMLFSEVVMSDIVSMLFVATSVYLLYKGINYSEYFYIGSFIIGITLGVRQTNFVLIPLFLIASIYRKSLKDFVLSSAAVSIGVALWLIPMIMVTGLHAFISIMKDYGKSAVEMGTLNQMGGLNLYNLIITIKSLIILFVDAWSPAIFVFGLMVAAVILLGKQDFRKRIADKHLVILLAWLVPYFILFILITLLSTSRYLLPVFPPIAIIFGYSVLRMIDAVKAKFLRSILILTIVIAIAFMGYQSITTAYALHTTEPAPVVAADFIKGHYDPNATVIMAGDSFRHFQFYLPGFVVYPSWIAKPEEISKNFLKNETILYEKGTISFDDSDRCKQFERDFKIYPKHELVRLYEYNARTKGASFISKGDGWYSLDRFNNNSTRWMSSDAYLITYSGQNQTTKLSLQASSFYSNRTIEVYSGNLLLGRKIVPSGGIFKTVEVPIRLVRGMNTIKLHVPEGCEMPCNKLNIKSGFTYSDCRCISLAIQNVKLGSQDDSKRISSNI